MGETPRTIEPAGGLDELKALLFQGEARRLAEVESGVSRLDARVGDAPRLEQATAEILVEALRKAEVDRHRDVIGRRDDDVFVVGRIDVWTRGRIRVGRYRGHIHFDRCDRDVTRRDEIVVGDRDVDHPVCRIGICRAVMEGDLFQRGLVGRE